MFNDEHQPVTDLRIKVSGMTSPHSVLTSVYAMLKQEVSVDLACEFLMEAATSKGDLERLLRICREYVICE